MSASWLKKVYRFLNYKILIYLCLVIICVQFYLGFTFYSHYEKELKEVNLNSVSENQLHSLRKRAYIKSQSQNRAGDSQSESHLSLWNPDKARKDVIDGLYTKAGVTCDSMNKDALSAHTRAKTGECKEAIQRVSCLVEHQKLFPSRLPRYCPLKGADRGKYLGCYKDDLSDRDFSGPKHKAPSNSPKYCTIICLASGYKFAGLQYSQECWCSQSYGRHGLLPETSCNQACPSNHSLMCGGLSSLSVYATGYGSRPDGIQQTAVAPAVLDVETSHMVRILFMFTWNGRAWRQVKRLFKQLYHVNHYYYIHIDAREDYLYRQALTLADEFDNVRVVRRRIATIWGGASLLQMLLQTMREALDMTDWKWDFYMNLSESDYPVKSVEQLTAFLTANQGKNFLKSHGPDTPMFLRKQGLLRTFYECEYHLWRVGNRTVPTDIRIDGGSDWICLSRTFAKYVTTSQDDLVQGLSQYFQYALLPAESYFHTVLQNSEHCESFIDNNLHKTNWNRKRGCLCQYKHIVDWCGCSPLDFSNSQSDKDKISKTEDQLIFFARKFEAVVNNKIVNWIDEWLNSAYPAGTAGLTTYWQNTFHEEDGWRRSEDSQYIYYTSFARNTVRKIVQVNQAEHCNIVLTSIKEAHLISQSDTFDGLLVRFDGKYSNRQEVEWETHVKPKIKFVLIKPFGDISRIVDLQVGSVFDLKERIFRDYGQLLGSNTQNVTVVQTWQSGLAVNITLLVTDPLGVIAYIRNTTVPQGMDNMVVTKVNLRKPMLPGLWEAQLIYQNILVAKKQFLILPEIYTERVFPSRIPIYYDYSPYELSLPNDILQIYQNIISVEGQSYMSGEELKVILAGMGTRSVLDWADKLVNEFWKPHAACSISPTSSCDLIPMCNTTNWSSMSADPKSEIGHVNPQTGKITQIIHK